MSWSKDGYTISTELSRIDLDAAHAFLSATYWAAGIPKATLKRALEGSLCFGLFAPDGSQVGFARVVTDRATFAYLADVYVLDAHRGHGLARWLVEVIQGHPELQGLRRWMLATRDAHGLYQKLGYRPLAAPERFMERHFPEVYRSKAA